MNNKQTPDEGLLTPDTRADLVDSVLELHPKLSTKLQNTIINLVDLVAKAQLAKAKLIYEKQIDELKGESRARLEIIGRLTARCEQLINEAQVAKKQERDYVVSWLDDIFLCKSYNTEQRDELCRAMWQALKGDK